MKLRLFGVACAGILTLGLIETVVAAPIVIFTDNFDSEIGNALNYNSFTNWDVFDGTVDLVAQGEYRISCFGSVGKCVDLDGSALDAARFVTKQSFNLKPGIYELGFAISGNQRGDVVDTVTVSLGTIYSEVFTKSSGDPFEPVTRTIRVTAPVSVPITFDHAGGDNFGIILDNVSLYLSERIYTLPFLQPLLLDDPGS